MSVKKSLPKKVKKITPFKRVNLGKNSIARSKILFFSLLLLICLLITVVVAQQQQILTQYAQTSPSPTINLSSGTPTASSSTTPIFTLAPTFGCLGTSCVGTIVPIVTIATTPQPTVTPGVTIILPTNSNGKTPPGFFVSLIHRVSNWLSKFIRFGGNPPGNPNIPGTGINPTSIGSSSGSTTVITIGAGRGKNNATIIFPNSQNKNASNGGITVSPTPANPLQTLLHLLTQLLQSKSGSSKN